ncbi:MAG: hypothetical protein ABS944_09880 [Solibacillus sp.]|uniref:hypothetical protein n=1 Tax=unclassified Solibacillus TaxID=2637870 RepID=UPI0030F608CB
MFEEILFAQLQQYVDREVTVAVGEELITGTLLSVNLEFLTLIESTDTYERETTTRIIVLSELSYVQVAETA